MRTDEATRDSRVKKFVRLFAILTIICAAGPVTARAQAVVLAGAKLRISISAAGSEQRELIEIRDDETWADVLDTRGPVTRARVSGEGRGCTLQSARVVGAAIVTKGDCGSGRVERELRLGPKGDTVAVRV